MMKEQTVMKEKDKQAASMQLMVRLVVTDEKGRVIKDTGDVPSRSYVIQFLEHIYAFLSKPSTLSITDVAGAESICYSNVNTCEKHMRFDGGIGASQYGIVVGSGDTAPTNTDFKLETQITHGTGAGKITHNVCTVDEVTAVVGVNVDLILLRSFTNNTGALRTVKEVGIYVKQTITPEYFCIIRDVLGSPVEVPDKCSLSVYYTMRTTV